MLQTKRKTAQQRREGINKLVGQKNGKEEGTEKAKAKAKAENAQKYQNKQQLAGKW